MIVLYKTTVKWLFCTKQQLNGCFVAALEKGGSPENVHVLYCHIKLAFPLTFHVFGSCFRMLSDFLSFSSSHHSVFQVL